MDAVLLYRIAGVPSVAAPLLDWGRLLHAPVGGCQEGAGGEGEGGGDTENVADQPQHYRLRVPLGRRRVQQKQIVSTSGR